MDLINQQRAYLPTKDWGSTDLAKQTWGLSDRKQEYDLKKLAFESTEIDI
jgi:hypothetical protein